MKTENIKSFKGPIFIAGCGRSGTSYLKSLIDAHSKIFIPSESLFIIDYLKKNYSTSYILKKLFWIEPQLNSWYFQEKFETSEFHKAVEKTHMLQASKESKEIWGQKTPRFIRYKKLFDKYYPDGKWILIYRDPRGVVASMIESKSHYYSIYFATKRWNRDNRFLLDHINDQNVYTLSYESLISDTQSEIDKILHFLGLEHISVELLIKNAKDREYTNSRFKNLSIKKGFKPLNNKIFDWENRLNKQQVNDIEYYSKDIMTELNYPLQYNNHTKPSFFNIFSTKDFLIFFEYLFKWPSYLIITILRKITIRLVK